MPFFFFIQTNILVDAILSCDPNQYLVDVILILIQTNISVDAIISSDPNQYLVDAILYFDPNKYFCRHHSLVWAKPSHLFPAHSKTCFKLGKIVFSWENHTQCILGTLTLNKYLLICIELEDISQNVQWIWIQHDECFKGYKYFFFLVFPASLLTRLF